jgi:MFS family permease
MLSVNGFKVSGERSTRKKLLGEQSFRCIFAAQLGSSAADGFLPLAESFAILQITRSVGDLGLVLSVQGAASLALSLFAGVAADRLPRVALLTVSSAVRMAAAVTLAIVLMAHMASVGWFLGAAVVYGGADALFAPTRTAILPDIVSAEDLGEANGLIGSFSSLCWLVAPSVAGVMVSTLGPGSAFIGEGALMAFTLLSLMMVHIPVSDGPQQEPMGSLLTQMNRGWKEFRARRWLWLLTLQWTLFSLILLAPLSVIGPTIARNYFGGAVAWGVISTCMAAGLVGAQLFGGRIHPKRPASFVALLAPIAVPEALALGLGAPVTVVSVAAVVTGAALGLQTRFFQTTIQQGVPGDVLGRVAAFDLVASEIGQPVGYAIAGPIGLAIGLHRLLLACAVFGFSATAIFALLLPRTEQPKLTENLDKPVELHENFLET